MIYIFWTCAHYEEAKKIIHLLLHNRLIACASILSEVESFYRWEGAIQEAKEVKVLIKTRKPFFDPICALICKEGSYQVPEIAQIDVTKCNPSYLSWILSETQEEMG